MQLPESHAILQIIDHVAIVLCQASQLAQARLASATSPVLRSMMERDHLVTDLELHRRELAVLRDQRAGLPPAKRPDYSPEQRLAILQIRRLRGWNVRYTSDRFVVHPNTIRSWIKAVGNNSKAGSLLGQLPWNKIDDAVRWGAHQLRRLFPEPEFGTRTIARHLIRAGIKTSRSTVQRVLREDRPPRPRRPKPPMNAALGVAPHHLLTPEEYNRVWHLDLMRLRILWLRFTITALMDGYTRKLLQLKVYPGTPNSKHMINLVRQSVMQFDRPRFLVTDHGTQFRKRFRRAIEAMAISVVKGRVRAPSFNGKIERLFRTLRLWQRSTLLAVMTSGIQYRLNRFRDWYNAQRPHQALGNLTPDEVWSEQELAKPIPIRAAEGFQVAVGVRRSNYRGDARLPLPVIKVELLCAA